jgi:hypothetical protein
MSDADIEGIVDIMLNPNFNTGQANNEVLDVIQHTQTSMDNHRNTKLGAVAAIPPVQDFVKVGISIHDNRLQTWAGKHNIIHADMYRVFDMPLVPMLDPTGAPLLDASATFILPMRDITDGKLIHVKVARRIEELMQTKDFYSAAGQIAVAAGTAAHLLSDLAVPFRLVGDTAAGGHPGQANQGLPEHIYATLF